MKQCLSCGMPMGNAEDHGGGDTGNDWCLHCCHQDGRHKGRDEVLDGMSRFLMSPEVERMGVERAKTPEEARSRAEAHMAEQPAWQE